jgi:hypothetical protein
MYGFSSKLWRSCDHEFAEQFRKKKRRNLLKDREELTKLFSVALL